MIANIDIGNHRIGSGEPVYIIAEMSANHNRDFDRAIRIIHAAKEAGADALKLQTYTPDTLTIDCDNEYFRIKDTIWEGRTLYDLYKEAYMPWEWQPKLMEVAQKLGIDLFSTPFDKTSVDFLEEMNIPAYKVASFEIVDIPLLEYIASKGRPMIISTGMATLEEIEEAVQASYSAGAKQIALLKCTSGYPASPDEMNLCTIAHLRETFDVPVGLSDHTTGIAVPVAAVATGACIVEKHLTLSRSIPSPDSAFSLEPPEFKAMVKAIRIAERSLGQVQYQASEQEAKSGAFRRSLFVTRDVKQGEVFTVDNVRSIRPGFGLPPKHAVDIYGKKARTDVKRGMPLEWNMIDS